MTTIKIRGGTAAQWASANPILAAREPGVETDTGVYKVGDGATAWASLNPVLNSTYVRIPSRNVWAVGDSLTAGNNTFDPVMVSTLQGGIEYGGSSWQTYAMLASDARWTMAGYSATTGYTAAQILATHVPAVIAASQPGDVVVVLAGTNGNVLADVVAIHAALRAAGRRTVACTVPPSTASTLSLVAGLNAGVANYARANGIPLADIHSAVVDTATGAYLSAYNGDGVHPNAAGYKVLGTTIAAALASIFTTPGGALVGHNAAFTGQNQPNPLALNALTLGVDYNTLAGLGTSTVAQGANAAFVGGQGYLLTRGDTDINVRLALWTLVAGHRYRIGMAWQNTIAASGLVAMSLQSNTTGLKPVWAMGSPNTIGQSVAAGRFYSEFVCPTLPDYTYRMKVNVYTGAASTLHLGEITLQDLTAMGAA